MRWRCEHHAVWYHSVGCIRRWGICAKHGCWELSRRHAARAMAMRVLLSYSNLLPGPLRCFLLAPSCCVTSPVPPLPFLAPLQSPPAAVRPHLSPPPPCPPTAAGAASCCATSPVAPPPCPPFVAGAASCCASRRCRQGLRMQRGPTCRCTSTTSPPRTTPSSASGC